MKKLIIAAVLVFGLLSLNSCKKKEVESATTPTEASSNDSTEKTSEAATASEPKTYTVTATPETVLIGKNKEASLKILNLKATALSDPDGKDLGIEMSYDIELTNKNTVAQGGYVQVDPSKFRLVLDNGSKITHDSYNSVMTNPDETKTGTGNIFKIPAGAKPVALNIFYDDTIVNVKLDLK